MSIAGPGSLIRALLFVAFFRQHSIHVKQFDNICYIALSLSRPRKAGAAAHARFVTVPISHQYALRFEYLNAAELEKTIYCGEPPDCVYICQPTTIFLLFPLRRELLRQFCAKCIFLPAIFGYLVKVYMPCREGAAVFRGFLIIAKYEQNMYNLSIKKYRRYRRGSHMGLASLPGSP